ncbi:MAG TPA: ATP-binding protein [Thermoanaerobaculia bacterium]|nr:ATP-binding protein [Thermoanaerobaculia bacterium]
MHYERRIVLTAILALAPVALAALLLVFAGDFSAKVRWTVLVAIAVGTFIATYVLHEQLVFPLRTISNIITALREEDYSLRGRNTRRDDALGEVMTEVNALAELMESRKLEAVEAAALLRAVLAQIDAAIFAFDDNDRLRLVNLAGERLLGQPRERLLGRTASDTGLTELLSEDAPAAIDRTFPGGAGRWDIHRSSFRERGVPHRLLVLVDITRALREEEAEAWRRIVRVLGHELNNSLAPIKSIATSLEQLVSRDELPEDWRDDLARGMRVIGSRTEALTRFTHAYARLARLPEPKKRDVGVGALVQRVAALETRVPIEIQGPQTQVQADEDQLEQLLINLVKNAADAARERVAIRWSANGDGLTMLVEDDGPGVSGTANLFVPFFTTKPAGSGIGLFLSRQIAEAHGGTLTLENRADVNGAVATLRLPITPSAAR